jgi:TIR domain
MSGTPAKPITVFYSYAHEDELLRKELEKHLTSVLSQELINPWHDRLIAAGTEWGHAINEQLNTASLIFLLISPDFMASEYCYRIEMPRAMQRYHAQQARVIPIILRHVDWTDTPFSKLQALPTDGRPVAAWANADEAFLNVAMGVRDAIKDLNAQVLQRDPTRLPNDPISHFISLETYLKPVGHKFPTEHDFAQGRVYLAEPYASQIREALDEKRHTLLVGHPAAGKTVLAIALAKELQEQAGYHVSYKDAAQAEVGDGRKWYRLMHEHDRANVLYILDNCHLATREVNEFCRQWQENPPRHAQCLLISRPNMGVTEPEENDDDYFERCAAATIKIESKHIYNEILKKYETLYRQQYPQHYTPLIEDDAQLLARQHAHNLVTSKSRLEIWRNLGGRLSEVTEEDVYHVLEKRYMTLGRTALAALCALHQYEIRAHTSFVETLSSVEVKQLQVAKLLTYAIVPGYGQLYELVFHPEEAQELFKAYVYRKYGSVTDHLVASEIENGLRAYLLVKPPNYMLLYEGLVRQKRRALLKRFLKDEELQNCAAGQFKAGNILDTIGYLYRVSKVDPARAGELLHTAEHALGGIRVMGSKIVERPFQEILTMLRNVRQIDEESARRIVARIDLNQLTRRSETANLQQLSWLLYILNSISPAQAEALLKNFPMPALAAKVTRSNVSSIEQILTYMQKFGCSSTQVEHFTQALDVGLLVQQAKKENIQHLYWLLHSLKKVAPVLADRFLEVLTPAGLASLCRVKQVNIAAIGQFRKVTTTTFWRLFLRQFSTQEIATLCDRSPLGALGMFVKHTYFSIQPGYALFQEQFLQARLSTESLAEIGKFIHRIQEVPGQGSVLARNALDLLVTIDLSKRIAGSDLLAFAHLLHNARVIDTTYALRLLVPLEQAKIVQDAMERSEVSSIQRLIHNVAEIDKRYLRYIQEGLQATNRADKLEKARELLEDKRGEQDEEGEHF